MNHLKTSITAGEIMDKKFPIIDSSLPLITCFRKMKRKHEACLIIKNGNFSGILGREDMLREFIYGMDKDAKIEKIKTKNNFKFVKPDFDVYKTLDLIREGDVNYIIVKERNNFLGLITKKEITDIEPVLLEKVKEKKLDI